MKTINILLRTALTLLLVVSIALPAGAVKYTYDDLDRLVEVEYESGQKITYTYDAGGNIINIEVYIPLKLEPIGDREIDEGQHLEFTVTATGTTGETVTYTAENLPAGAAFDPATGVFSWTPTYSQAGVYPDVRFTAISGGAVVSESITITVHRVNTPPGENVVVEDEAAGITFTFDRVDQPGDTTVNIYETLPEGHFYNVSFLPFYFDITTTARFSGQVRIRAAYNPADFALNEADIRLYHIRDGEALDITSPVNPGPGGNPDTEAHTVEGVTTGFSFFALGLDPRLNFTTGDGSRQLYSPPAVEATWTSSNETVATVSETGLVTPLSIGTAEITYTTFDELHTVIFEVTVNPRFHWLPPTSILEIISKYYIPMIISPNQTVPVRFCLAGETGQRLHLDNIAVEVRSIDDNKLLAGYTLEGKGRWKLDLNRQGIYHANVHCNLLNLQPGQKYRIAVTLDNREIDHITITVR